MWRALYNSGHAKGLSSEFEILGGADHRHYSGGVLPSFLKRRKKENISNSALRPFPQPELYQSAHGKVLAIYFAHRRQIGNESTTNLAARLGLDQLHVSMISSENAKLNNSTFLRRRRNSKTLVPRSKRGSGVSALTQNPVDVWFKLSVSPGGIRNRLTAQVPPELKPRKTKIYIV
ncbi:hypothetical protein K438DRAFT_1760384 [Mycena galopus ATCC 62051]|nr:hypothetical protein K438DRAFT_1760384 [Mycena galopus ATCC 62051]